MDKYQRALETMKEGRTWQTVADLLGTALGETIHRSDAHGTAKGNWQSVKVRRALELMGAVSIPKKRIRLAADCPSLQARQEFKEFYGIDDDNSFGDWLWDTYEKDKLESFRRTDNGCRTV